MTAASPQTSISDEALAAAAREGCTASFEQLVVRYQAPLLRFLYRRCGDRAEAEDLVQECFVRAYRRLDRYDPARPLRPWMFTIAARLAINHRRRRWRWWPLPADASQFPRAVPNDGGNTENTGIWDFARRCLDGRAFTALWLFYVEDLSVNEIATAVQRSPGAVKTMLSRARQTLRRQWAEQTGER